MREKALKAKEQLLKLKDADLKTRVMMYFVEGPILELRKYVESHWSHVANAGFVAFTINNAAGNPVKKCFFKIFLTNCDRVTGKINTEAYEKQLKELESFRFTTQARSYKMEAIPENRPIGRG